MVLHGTRQPGVLSKTLGFQVHHPDEGYIKGTFYITSRFTLGTPSAAEISSQSNELAAFRYER
jgi:hypothetical protein